MSLRTKGKHQVETLPSAAQLQREYDSWHQRAFDADREHDDASSPWYELVRERVGDVRDLHVLEVACGRGGFVRELRQKGAIVTGCDFSKAALCVGNQRVKGTGDGGVSCRFVQGDAQSLPFADAVFDLVVSCETVEHLPDPASAISEMHRVTRPGGRLLLTTPNYFNLMGLYELYARIVHPGRKDDQPFDRRQWFPQIRDQIRAAGWRITETDGTVHQFPVIPRRSPVRLMAVEWNRTLRKLLSPFALHYFVMAEKNSA
jgi:SAM-dependent methyltransferase